MHTEVVTRAGPASRWERVRTLVPWPELLASWLAARVVVGVSLLLVRYLQ